MPPRPSETCGGNNAQRCSLRGLSYQATGASTIAMARALCGLINPDARNSGQFDRFGHITASHDLTVPALRAKNACSFPPTLEAQSCAHSGICCWQRRWLSWHLPFGQAVTPQHNEACVARPPPSGGRAVRPSLGRCYARTFTQQNGTAAIPTSGRHKSTWQMAI